MERFFKNIKGSLFWRRTLAVLLSLAVLVTLAPSNTYLVFPDDTTQSILGNTGVDLSAVTLKACYYDENGNWVEVTLTQDGDFTTIPYNATIEMTLDFTMVDGNLLEVDTEYVYELPPTIRVDENGVTHQLAYQTTDGQEVSIGTVTIYSDGTLHFVFRDNITGQTNIPFYVKFDGELSDDLQESDQNATISFPTASGSYDFNITTTDAVDEDVDKTPADIGMSKSGSVVTVNGQKYILWTVTLSANGRDSLTGTITDNLPDGITYANVNGYPKISSNWSSYTEMSDVSITDGSRSVSILLDGVTGSTVSVQFLTYYDSSIFGDTVSNSTVNIENTASFDSEDTEDTDPEASTTVWVTPNMVSKSGTLDSDGTITWTVTINAEQFDIGGTTYTDTFGSGITLTGDISVSSSDGTTDFTSYVATTGSLSATGFTITFPSGYSGTATVTYTTTISDYSQISYTNTGELKGTGYDYSTTAYVNGLDLLSKTSVSYNSLTREFTWNIYVDNAGQTLNNVEVTDYLKKVSAIYGDDAMYMMKYVSAEITSGTSGTDYTNFSMRPTSLNDVDYTGDTASVAFSFDSISAPVVITVVTKMTDEFYDKYLDSGYFAFTNYVKLKSDEVTELEKDASRSVAVTAPVLIESKTGTINSDGTIDWTVVVKAQDAEYIPDSYTLSDTLPDDNEYVDGSLYVQNRYWDSDPISSADGEITVTCTKPEGSDNYVLSATIDETLCNTYGKTWLTDGDAFEIHYQTKVTDYETAVASTSYTNKATITASYPDIDDVEDTEVCTVTGIAGGVLDKTYSYKTGSSTVTWTITINEAGNDMSDIDNPRIVDELEDYFDYVPNSGVLYKVTDSGNVEVSEDDYEISAVNGTIIVWLPNIGTDTYVFVFQTAFNVRAEALQGTSVTNTVSFYGDGEIATEESEEITNINFSSSSAGSYLKQEFRIQKVDSSSGDALAGATFYLYRNGEIVASATTDSDGWAVFDNMDFGATYSVIEYQAPDGYEKTDGSVTFDFKNDSSLTIVEESSVSRYYQYTWANTAVSTSSATIRATKVDSESGEVITDGVTFGLYSDSSCQTLIESRTTVKGVVSFSGITEAGTYYLKELSAPAGYTLSDEVVKVVVASDGNNPPTYTVTYYSGVDSNTSVTVDSDTGYLYNDTKATGTLSITKVDADDNDTKIENVTFELYTDAIVRNPIDSQTTDADGVATFTGLELGKTYYYREVSVPDTYVKDDTIYSITIGTGSETEDQTASVVVENEAALGDIVVTKVDDSVTPNAISGVTFTLQVWNEAQGTYVDYTVASDTDPNTQVTYTVTTDDDGVARFENLPFGTYRVVETVPSGYSADSIYTEITVSSTGDTNVQIVNEVIRFNLQVVKTDDSGTPLANVGFTLYTASGIPVYTDVRTDENGTIEFTGLKYGSYYLHETYTPAGYTAAEDVWITLTDVDDAVNTAGTSDTPVVTKTIVNEKQNGALLAHKVDGDSAALGGAGFTLYDENNKVVATATSLTADEATSANSSLEDIWKTTNDITLQAGDIWFSGLSFGTYYLVETSAPSGYQVNTGRYKVEITESGTVVKTGIDVNTIGAMEATLTITDTKSTPPYISFKLKKTDEDRTPLSGAIFYLYQDDDRETPVAIATTDDNGIAYFRMINTSTNSITSYYSIVEVYAPYGYKTSDTVLYISQSYLNIYTDDDGSPLSDGDIQYVGQSEAAATVTNEQILGEIQITKYGTTRLETLSGAVFTLYNADDDSEVATATTNASGIATFSNLPVGSYYVKETTAPAGYTLSSQIVNIEVTDDTTYTASYLDTRLQLSVSKQSVTQSGEIAGAVLTLYRLDDDGNRVETVDSWTSTTSVHKVTYSKLQTGVTYELVETTAPAGYGYSDPVKFRIQTDGSIVLVDDANAETSNPNGTTIVMKDTPITLSVKKQDASGDALSNAILAIYDSNGTELTRFTTGSSAKVIDTSIFNAPATSGSYTYYSLKELSAPSGYALASDVEFAIGYDGSVYEVTNGTVGNQIASAVITMTDTMKPDTSIYILKVDGGTGTDLAGSKFQLLNYDGSKQIDINNDTYITSDDTLVSTGTAIEILNINNLLNQTTNGQFILREIEAPTGYDLAADLYFTVTLNGSTNKYEITVSYADRDTLNATKDTLTVADDELHVYIRKQDGFGTLLAGAELILYEKTDDNGGKTQVGDALITSNTEVISIESSLLKVNTTYILHESNSPAGYGLADDIEFTIQSDGSITRTDGTTVYNDTIIMQDDESDVTIHKVIEGTSEVLTGVTLQLTSEDDIYFTTMEWTSTDDIKVWEIAFTELTVGCSYTLSETQAPAGYTYADPITFTVGDDRQIYVDGVAVNLRDIVMEDCPIELYISKQDMTSREELSGAVLRLSDEAGNLIYEFTSGDTKTLIPAEKLVAAKEGEYVIYTLTETLAPYGYEQAETITFALDSKGIAYLVTERDDGSVDYEQLGNTVTMLDEPMLSIVKQDEEGNVVTGASLMITAEDDESFTPIEFVSERDLTYFSWDTFQVGKTYRITETEVPQGYLCADDILFRIDEDHNIYIDGASKPLSGKSIAVTDQAITVAVVKRDAENSAELAGATLTIQDKSGTVLYTFVSGTSQVTLPNTLFTAPEEGTFSYYSLSEVTAPDGYDIAETIHFAVNQDGQIFVLSEDSIYEPLEDHTIIMYDKRTGGSDIHPKTGDTVPLYLVGLNALLSLFAACLLLYRYLFGRKR